MKILLHKCLLICLMLGISLQGIGASFVQDCDHSHRDAQPVAEHAAHHDMHSNINSHDMSHSFAAMERGICDDCSQCNLCIAPPIPAVATTLPISIQSSELAKLPASLFLSVILEDPPRPPSCISCAL